MAALDAEPPRYIHSPLIGADDIELPAYSRVAAADERIMLARPTASRLPTVRTSEYIFHSERLELNMGQKKYPVKVPAYGWNDVVRGTITVKDFKAAAKVTVTLEGTCSTSVTDGGVALYTSSKTLVFMPRILWSRLETNTIPTQPEKFAFSFQLPTYAQGTNIRLPHSYEAMHTGFNADVTYQLRVDLFRKGLRRHECLKTMILYLPRSTPPDAPFQRRDSFSASQDAFEWENIPIYPTYRLSPSKGKVNKILTEENPTEAVNLVLPLSHAYASNAPIPFHILLPADPFVPQIVVHASVHLIKCTIIRAGGFVSSREGIIGTAEIRRVDGGSYPNPPPIPSEGQGFTYEARKAYFGIIKSFREEGEANWNIPEFLEVKYTLRIRIQIKDTQSDGKQLPDYILDHPIQMCTHPHIPNSSDIHEPAIGLIAVFGSQGLSTNRLPPPSAIASNRPQDD